MQNKYSSVIIWFLILTAVGCNQSVPVETDSNSDTNSDSDEGPTTSDSHSEADSETSTDGDADADADTDADTDSDSDTVADTASDTDTTKRPVVYLDTDALTHEYQQTGNTLMFPAKNIFTNLLLGTTAEGNIVVAGATSEPTAVGLEPDTDTDTDAVIPIIPFLMLLSPEGEQLHRWVYPDADVFEAMAVTHENKVVLVGSIVQDITLGGKSAVAPAGDAYFYAVVDIETGLADVVSSYPTEDYFYISNMTVDDDGYVYIAGALGTSSQSPLVSKHHPMGTTMWERSYESCDSTAYFTDVEITPAGELVGVGAFNCSLVTDDQTFTVAYSDNNYWYYDGFAVWLNTETGVTENSMTVSGLEFDYLKSLNVLPSGDYRMGGNVDGVITVDGTDIIGDVEGSSVMYELSASGHLNWAFVLTGDNVLFNSGIDDRNRTHMIGRLNTTDIINGITEAYIVALDETGVPKAFISFPNNANGGQNVAFDGSGGIWLAGDFYQEMTAPNGEMFQVEHNGLYLMRLELLEK